MRATDLFRRQRKLANTVNELEHQLELAEAVTERYRTTAVEHRMRLVHEIEMRNAAEQKLRHLADRCKDVWPAWEQVKRNGVDLDVESLGQCLVAPWDHVHYFEGRIRGLSHSSV